MPKADIVTREILHHALLAVAEEMAVVQYRSSFSPIIREIKDFSCALFDARGRIIAHSDAIPAQLGLMQFALAGALEVNGELAPGDLVLCNHPYRGGTHTPDLQLFAPIYVDGELTGYSGSIAHHINIGGSKSGDSTDNAILFEEGVLCPGLKLYSEGVRNDELQRLIEANVRDPEATTGDLAAQAAACRRGGERIAELCDRNGHELVREAMDAILDLTSERVAAELRSWPQKQVRVEGYMDYDTLDPGVPIHVVAVVTVEDDQLVIDLSESSVQVRGSINVPWSSTNSAGYFALRCFVGEEIEMNEGLTRHVKVIAPEGSIFRPRFPRPVAGRHLTVQRLAELLCRAIGEILPERAVASSHVSFPSFNFQTAEAGSERLALFADVLGGGGGARPHAAGDNGIDSYTSNCALLSAEVAELEYPWRIERTELVADSGGSGQWRGGCGIRRDYRLIADAAEGPYYIEQSNPDFGARGLMGGGRGAPARVRVRSGGDGWAALPPKGYAHLSFGDVISFESAGGGGFGAPGQNGSASESVEREEHQSGQAHADQPHEAVGQLRRTTS